MHLLLTEMYINFNLKIQVLKVLQVRFIGHFICLTVKLMRKNKTLNAQLKKQHE